MSPFFSETASPILMKLGIHFTHRLQMVLNSDENHLKVRHFLNFFLPILVDLFSILFIIILLSKKFQTSQVFGTFQTVLHKSKVRDLATLIVYINAKINTKISTSQCCVSSPHLRLVQAFGERPPLVKTASKVGWTQVPRFHTVR